MEIVRLGGFACVVLKKSGNERMDRRSRTHAISFPEADEYTRPVAAQSTSYMLPRSENEMTGDTTFDTESADGSMNTRSVARRA